MSTDALREVDEEKVLADRLREERPDLSTLNLGALLARARSLRPYLQQMFGRRSGRRSAPRSAPARSARSRPASAIRP